MTGQQNMLHTMMSNSGVSLLTLVQFCLIWFGVMIAAASLFGIIWQQQGKEAGIKWRNFYLFFGICLLYALLNSLIIIR